MKLHSHKRSVRNAESGYALILIMFFLALLVVSTFVAAPTVLSSIQREREAEMVWRGKQYVRGVRLYYLKMHHFPTSLDDLTKPKTGIRFMRQAYKDPMNQVDGTWRLIYVGPNGQLIGSLKDPSTTNPFGQMAQSPAGAQGFGSSLFASPNGSGSGNSAFGSSNSTNSFSSSFGQSSTFGQNSSFGQTAGSTQGAAVGTALQNSSSPTDPNAQNPNGGNPGAPSDSGQPAPLGMMDASNTIGGNIIGVGSKINKQSFLWYEKAKNYRQFEFIWDPSKDMRVGGASVGIGTPAQNLNGTNPQGTGSTNSPFAPGTNPNQNPAQNQNPAPNQTPPANQNPNGNPDPTDTQPLQAPPPNP